MAQGKLIVVDGGDGAGKETQGKLLSARLESDGYEVESLDFPQYTENTFGQLIRECLDGKRGDFLKVDARVASVLYAADRFESKATLDSWLEEGKIVMLDRYVSSNMMHQGSKIHDQKELEDFLTWIDHIEHEIFKIPRPDVTLYFDIPFEIRKALKEQAVREGKHTGELDLAERDQEHQRATEECARVIARMRTGWNRIDCTNEGELRSREDIHEEAYEIVKKIIA